MTIIHGDSRVHIEAAGELDRLVARLKDAKRRGEAFGVDYETTGPSIKGKGSGKSKPDVRRHLPVGAGFAFVDGERVYLPFGVGGWDWGSLGAQRRILTIFRHTVQVWAHNAGFEYAVTQNVGVEPGCEWFDSMVAAWLAGWKLDGKGGLKLKPLASVYLGYRGPTFEDVANGRDAADIPVEELAPYCANDAWLSLTLGCKAMAEFDRLKVWRAWDLERRVMPATVHMESTGVPLDEPLLLDAAARCEAEMEVVEAEFKRLTTTRVMLPTKVRRAKRCAACAGKGMCDAPGCMNGMLHFKNGKPRMETVEELAPTLAGADIGSDEQVSRWLFDELAWWPKVGHPLTKKSKRPSTKADHVIPLATLPGQAGEAARLRLRFQALRKYASTYTRGLVDFSHQAGDGKLHTSYKQTGTDTSRYSSSLPNISNLPSTKRQELPWLADLPDIRAAFLPKPGWRTVIFDYSQIELRLLAHYSQDPGLLAAYPWEGEARDLHAELVTTLGCDRRSAKIIRFSSMYMISPPRLALKMKLGTNDWSGKFTPEYASEALDTLWTLHPQVPAYWGAAIAYAREHGYATTLSGFKRPIKGWGSRKETGRSSRQAVNVPIQGSAGAVLKWALASLYELWKGKGWLGTYVNIQGQTYDEIITEVHPEWVDAVKADMQRVMVAAGVHFKLRVPLAVEGGDGANWSEAK